jgi:hypothetical protein
MRIFIYLLLMLSLFGSCTNTPNEISAEERYIIDTMSENILLRNKVLWDQSCSKKQDSLVKISVDSLMEATVLKINTKIKKEQ